MHKLLFYCQVRALRTTGKALFSEKIIAWDYGASIPEVYKLHKGKEYISWSELPLKEMVGLTVEQKAIVLETLSLYGRYNNHVLAEMNYSNKAYIKARKNLGAFGKATDDNIIEHRDMVSSE